jgi:Leucine-rich repeat (LRR) protein
VLQLNDVGLQMIGKSLRQYNSIELLELCDNKLKSVPPEVLQLANLKSLKLDNNYIKKVECLNALKIVAGVN